MTIRRAYADLPHGQVHYACAGDPHADAVLLLHQTPRSWLEYKDVLPLIGQRFRAIAMDTAGFGASDPPAEPASIEAWAAIAAQLLDHLGIASAHVVGHHTGGVIAVELAARHGHKVRSLVLSSTPCTDAAFRRVRATRPPIDAVEQQPDGSHLVQLWRNRAGFYPADRPDLLQAFVTDALKVGGDVEAGHRAVASYRMEDRLHTVRQPTLVVSALKDPFAASHAAHWQALLPDVEVVEIADGMVPLPDQLPHAFASAVLDFLERRP